MINRQFLLWDGWSNGLVVSQLLALYDTGGDDSAFGEPEGSFETYLAWLADRDGAAADEGWRGALAGLEEPTLVAEPMPGVEVQLPDRRDAVLSETLSRALRERAAASGVTFNTVLNAALALVLASATGRQDVVFGSTVADGRRRYRESTPWWACSSTPFPFGCNWIRTRASRNFFVGHRRIDFR